MPVSSAAFETTLEPDAGLRRIVSYSGVLAGLAGAAICLAMPLAPGLRVLLVAAWTGETFREWRALARGRARLRALRLDADGNIAGVGRDGRPVPLQLLAGSMVLDRLAWLRLRFPDGSQYGELFAGNAALDPAWHRLQLLWKLRRGAFGRPDGS